MTKPLALWSVAKIILRSLRPGARPLGKQRQQCVLALKPHEIAVHRSDELIKMQVIHERIRHFETHAVFGQHEGLLGTRAQASDGGQCLGDRGV